MKLVDSLNWKFDFGKHKYQTIREAIESYPSSTSSGLVDIHGETKFAGVNIPIFNSLITYLEWAEKEEILKILPELWKTIKIYDDLYTKIRSYENGSKNITSKDYYIYVERIKNFRNE